MTNRDNGGGYYDYDRLKFREQVHWKNENWTISGTARATWYDYITQTDPSSLDYRTRSNIALELRAERLLGKHNYSEHCFYHSNFQ